MQSEKQGSTRPVRRSTPSTDRAARSAAPERPDRVPGPAEPPPDRAATDRADRAAEPAEGAATPVPETAFSPHFLERARCREAAAGVRAGVRPGKGAGMGAGLTHTPLARCSRWRGPWGVERVAAGDGVLHAASRRAEPAREAGDARLSCILRQEALLATAAFTAVATPNHLSLNTGKPSGGRSRTRLGFPIHDGARHLGHVKPVVEGSEEAFLAAYHTLRCLAADPDAAALFLEALDPETLAVLGRAVMRRLG